MAHETCEAQYSRAAFYFPEHLPLESSPVVEAAGEATSEEEGATDGCV